MLRSININSISKSEYEHYRSLMSAQKRERIDRFRSEEDKLRSVCGELLARRMISKTCGVDEESIILDLSENGKPYARGIDVQFSISHSGEYAVCALDREPVGVDIERIRSVDERLIRRCCVDDEIEYINAGSDEKDKRFFEIWTAKEAFFKCAGTGITDLKSVNTLDAGFRKHLRSFIENGYIISIYTKNEKTEQE